MARAVMPAILLAQAQELGQLVQHLVLDHGRFHVGDEQLLAPAGRRHDHRVDRRSWRPAAASPSNGMSQAISGASQSGVPTVAPCARSSSTARLHGAVVERGMGGDWRSGRGRSSRSGSSGGMTDLQAAFARHGQPARHRHHRPDGQRQVGAGARARRAARRHGDQRRCHADLRRLPDPDRAAHGGRTQRACRMRSTASCRSARPCRRRAGATLATAEIERCLAAGRMPILCGGSGLYLRTLMQGIAAIPDVADRPARSGQCRVGVDGRATPSARGWPSSDPAIVARLKPGDRQRHVRAWEVWQATGRPLSAWQEGEGEPAPLALRRPCCWRRSAAGCGRASRRASTRC